MLYKVEILKGGRITLPIKLRREWNLSDGDALFLEQTEGLCKIKTTEDAIAEAQEAVKKYLADDSVSLNEELQNMRRTEFQQEENS